MARLTPCKTQDGRLLGYMFECPGCRQWHVVYTTDERENGGHKWAFNGDVNRPTFSPSLLVWRDHGPAEVQFRCHSFIRDGRVQFLSDCTHALAGQTVDLPEVSE